ncbi:hypothetical protein GCM10010168_28100 [Actinoplanes ianthinogenes]|uniref:histidine kinase n=1 Tax=Actinoplanes ianthinogenes TaxID=122358 RepID=A0ABM7LL13_9ACTN|nr:hypothetical protein Aiant_06080 [Actinoplanes ianthinogenes]GGR09238.1 hypothetical protein GCM10010168_28100 [Actinoplanes ianthinogenes]
MYCSGTVVGDPGQVLAVALQAYIAIEPTGRVIGWNPAAENTFGYRRGEACGRDLADLIIPARLRDAHRAGLVRLAAGGPARVLGQALSLVAVHQDGHEFPIDLMLTATDESCGTVFHAFVTDTTVSRRVSRYAAVESAVNRGLAEAGTYAAAAGRVVEALGVHMDWPVAELWLADTERRLITCIARHTAPGLRLGAFAFTELEPGVGLPGTVYQQSRPRWIPDLVADRTSPRSRIAAAIGLHVAVGVPVHGGGHTQGALCVYGNRAEHPEETLITLLSGIAAQVGQYLERRRAEELDIELARTKDEFLALVTHELRNPLAVITATTALFDEEIGTLDDDGQRKLVHTIAGSSQRLTVLVDDLLDLARLESGHLALHPTHTDLGHIIRDAAQDLTGPLAGKGLTLILHVPDPLPLYADPDRLRQVADNLLSNAVKYTPDGGTITVTAAIDAVHEEITWTVTDTGIGIPAGERHRMFRRFYRASSAIDRRIPGTGLGLVITRAIVEGHHGSITLGDQIGPGTTFRLRLPVKAPLAGS